MLAQHQMLFAKNVSKLIDYIFSEKFSCTFGEAYRPPETARYYASCGMGIRHSLHCQRLAIDLDLFDQEGNYLKNTEDYKKFGLYWESLHPLNKWGGNFHNGLLDGNHFQLSVNEDHVNTEQNVSAGR